MRNVIQLLVNAQKLWQGRAVLQDSLLNTIMALPPKKRAALSVADIASLTERVKPSIDADVQLKAEQVERSLGEREMRMVIEAIRVYASQQFWAK